ncbi:uncharacterized protein PRCAT00006019001 [Priceomyces carsonii]|uniref:uncharacterized protein n=1 Tax=Priceomyces carsonii TaxID=28549 RepID=UPI002EDA70B2|nr:unnamed protein product [Priceomyces carsonii]
MQYPYLISRVADPIFAISIGIASYYSHEQRVQRPEGHSLSDLIIRKYRRVFPADNKA